MSCEICDNKYADKVLFENDKMIVMLAINPATSGHIQIFSKNHYTIIEQVPEEELNFIATAANKASMLLFELMKVHGTNIIVQNGVPAGQTIPHFSMNIIPRRTDDGLKLDWDLKQATPESLDSMQSIINAGMILTDPAKANNDIKAVENSKPETPVMREETVAEGDIIKKKANYYLKSLERIP